MNIEYVILLEFSTGSVTVIKLTPEEIEKANECNDFEEFLRSLEDKYEFKLDDCQWMSTESLQIYYYQDGINKTNVSF